MQIDARRAFSLRETGSTSLKCLHHDTRCLRKHRGKSERHLICLAIGDESRETTQNDTTASSLSLGVFSRLKSSKLITELMKDFSNVAISQLV